MKFFIIYFSVQFALFVFGSLIKNAHYSKWFVTLEDGVWVWFPVVSTTKKSVSLLFLKWAIVKLYKRNA